MTAHTYFVDESKSGDFLLGVVSAPTPLTPQVSRAVRGFLLPGQRYLHTRKESPQRKAAALDLVCSAQVDFGLRLDIVNAGRSGSQVQRRADALGVLLERMQDGDHVVLDRDEGLESRDRQLLIAAQQRRGVAFSYMHAEPSEQLALGLADALVWGFRADNAYRSRLQPATIQIMHA